MVVGARVDGGAGTLDVVGATVVAGASVVVVAAVVGGVVVVSTDGGGGDGGGGGDDVAFGDGVPELRGGAMVTGGRAVVAVVTGTVSPGRVTTVVVDDVSVLLVDSATVDVGTGRKVVTVVDTMGGAWVATCFGVPAEPVATSNISPSMATDAKAYRPTLNR